jgi:hypothetical protein
MSNQLRSDEFFSVVNSLVEEFDIEEIIETGTCYGDGSTLVFAKTGLPVITIESLERNIRQAKFNLRFYNNVTFLHGSSLFVEDMVNFLTDEFPKFEFPEHVRHDVPTDMTFNFYLEEIRGTSENENLLVPLIKNDKRQIIFLDSGGGVGYLEFKTVMDNLDFVNLTKKILIMDDVNHVKHYKSVEDLKKVWPVNISSDGRFGWCNFIENANIKK